MKTFGFRIFRTNQSIRHHVYSNQVKYIVIIRNPENVFSDFSYRMSAITGEPCKEISKRLNKDFCGPSGTYGGWAKHLAGWWALRNRPNVLLLKYEDITQNFPLCCQKI